MLQKTSGIKLHANKTNFRFSGDKYCFWWLNWSWRRDKMNFYLQLCSRKPVSLSAESQNEIERDKTCVAVNVFDLFKALRRICATWFPSLLDSNADKCWDLHCKQIDGDYRHAILNPFRCLLLNFHKYFPTIRRFPPQFTEISHSSVRHPSNYSWNSSFRSLICNIMMIL